MGTLLERIEARIAALGISESEAERRAGLGRSWIHDLRRGQKRGPTYEDLKQLASALECDFMWLAEGIGDPTGGPALDPIDAELLATLRQYPKEDREAMLRILKGQRIKAAS